MAPHTPVGSCSLVLIPPPVAWLSAWGSSYAIKLSGYRWSIGPRSCIFIPQDFDIFSMLQSNTKLPVRPGRTLLPSTHIRIKGLPAWNTTLPGLIAHSFRVGSQVLMGQPPLLFFLNFRLVSQPSLWKLYPTPVPYSESSFWSPKVLGLCRGAVVMDLLSPETPCQNELGGLGGPSREETRLNSSSLILAVPPDGYQQSFQSVWKIIRRLSLPSSWSEPLLFPQGSWGSEEVPEGVGVFGSVHWYWSFIVIIKADFDWDLTLRQALCKVFLIVSFNPYKNRIRSELRHRG